MQAGIAATLVYLHEVVLAHVQSFQVGQTYRIEVCQTAVVHLNGLQLLAAIGEHYRAHVAIVVGIEVGQVHTFNQTQ